MKKTIFFVMIGIIVLAIILVISFICFVPKCGEFSVKDYEDEIAYGRKSNEIYGSIDNRFEAFIVGVQEIHECFPMSKKDYLYGIGANRELYYDQQSDTWLLRLSFEDGEDFVVIGGVHCCIMTSTGEILSCWREV